MKTRDLTLTALFAAILCVAAPFSIPVGPIPITLATFAIYLAAIVLGKKYGTLAVVIYILLGAVGLPVFSGFSGGFQKIVSATGGYIIGYIPCAFIVGAMCEYGGNKKIYGILGVILGTAVLYIIGTYWFMFVSGKELAYALGACILPFIPGDIIKLIVAVIVGYKLKGYAIKDIGTC